MISWSDYCCRYHLVAQVMTTEKIISLFLSLKQATQEKWDRRGWQERTSQEGSSMSCCCSMRLKRGREEGRDRETISENRHSVPPSSSSSSSWGEKLEERCCFYVSHPIVSGDHTSGNHHTYFPFSLSLSLLLQLIISFFLSLSSSSWPSATSDWWCIRVKPYAT